MTGVSLNYYNNQASTNDFKKETMFYPYEICKNVVRVFKFSIVSMAMYAIILWVTLT